MVNHALLLNSYKKWILRATIVEAAAACNQRVQTFYLGERRLDMFKPNLARDMLLLRYKLPKYPFIFVNQTTYFKALEIFPSNSLDNHSIFFTHFNESRLDKRSQIRLLSNCRQIFVYNSDVRREMIDLGLDERNVRVVYGAVDRQVFFPSRNFYETTQVPYVLVAGDCKIRKNPMLVMQICSKLLNLHFVIHGNGWDNIYNEFNRPPNVTIMKFQFKKQPQLMRNAHAYLSVSNLEGGPYPTLEALASGTPVCATDTGWNREVIPVDGGWVLPVNPELELACEILENTVRLKKSVFNRDMLSGGFTWSELGEKIFES